MKLPIYEISTCRSTMLSHMNGFMVKLTYYMKRKTKKNEYTPRCVQVFSFKNHAHIMGLQSINPCLPTLPLSHMVYILRSLIKKRLLYTMDSKIIIWINGQLNKLHFALEKESAPLISTDEVTWATTHIMVLWIQCKKKL